MVHLPDKHVLQSALIFVPTNCRAQLGADQTLKGLAGRISVPASLSMAEDPTLVSVLVKGMEEVEVILMTTKRVAVQDVSFLS